MSSTPRKSRTKTSPAVAPQLQTHTFSVYGWAMPVPNGFSSKEALFVNAYKQSSTNAKSIFKSKQPFRESLTLTSREKNDGGDDGDAGVRRFVVVGFAVLGLADEQTKKHNNLAKRQPAGTMVWDEIAIGDLQHVTLAVAAVSDVEEASTTIYALLNPVKGLCTPYVVAQPSVFYLAMYRDNTTSLHERGPHWNNLVREYSFRPTQEKASIRPSKKQLAHRRAANTTKVILDEFRSVMHEAVLYTEGFCRGGDVWHLEALKEALEQADADLLHMPVLDRSATHKFLNFDEDGWEESDAMHMVEEFLATWPQDESLVTPARVSILREQLQREKVVLEYFHLRSFILEGCYELERLFPTTNSPMTGNIASSSFASDILSRIQRILGDQKSAPMISPISDDVFRDTVIAFLDKMVAAGKDFDKKVKDNCGDAVGYDTIQAIWEDFADATDMDHAKLGFTQSARYFAVMKATKERGLTQMAGDLSGFLKQL